MDIIPTTKRSSCKGEDEDDPTTTTKREKRGNIIIINNKDNKRRRVRGGIGLQLLITCCWFVVVLILSNVLRFTSITAPRTLRAIYMTTTSTMTTTTMTTNTNSITYPNAIVDVAPDDQHAAGTAAATTHDDGIERGSTTNHTTTMTIAHHDHYPTNLRRIGTSAGNPTPILATTETTTTTTVKDTSKFKEEEEDEKKDKLEAAPQVPAAPVVETTAGMATTAAAATAAVAAQVTASISSAAETETNEVTRTTTDTTSTSLVTKAVKKATLDDVMESNKESELNNDIYAKKRKTNRTTTDNPFEHIILMGQFNWEDVPIEVVEKWVTVMSKVFGKVVIRGEFWNITKFEETFGSNTSIDVKLSDGSLQQPYWKRNGFFTPMNNMKHVLLEYNQYDIDNNKTYDGVLYMHDDSIPNLNIIAQGLMTQHDRQHTIVGTDIGKDINKDFSYTNPRTLLQSNHNKSQIEISRIEKTAYRLYPKNTTHPFSDVYGKNGMNNSREFHKQYLDKWGMRVAGDRCMNGQYAMTKDPDAEKFYEYDDDDDENKENPYMLFPSYTQADFLYVPFTYANLFAEMETLLEKHGVWIECGFPTIVDQILTRYPETAKTHVVPLCTAWNSRRKKPLMVEYCINQKGSDYYGVYHPLKPGSNITQFVEIFEDINKDWI